MFKNLKNKLKEKKGDLTLFGVIITITVAVFIQGYLDTTSANYIIDETQSIIDLTALTALESSVDTEGLAYERMTIRPWNYNYEANHVNQDQNLNLLTATEGNELYNYTIWLDGRNAYYIENNRQTYISDRIKSNFQYYMDQFIGSQIYADGVSILDYDLIAFTGSMTYDNWGINRKYSGDTITYEDVLAHKVGNTIVYDHGSVCATYKDYEGNDVPIYGTIHTADEYIYMPQATIDATIRLVVDVDPTFTTAFYSYALYNAQKTSANTGVQNILSNNAGGNNYTPAAGTYLIDSGFDANNNLVLTIRVLARETFY